jgi:hypothetical protein
MKRMLQNV